MKSNEEVWFYYEHIQKKEASGLSVKKYCEKAEISLIDFTNMHTRLVYISKSNPKLYSKLLPIARKYMTMNKIALKPLAEENNVDPDRLSAMATHLKYLDLLNEIKREKSNKDSKSMKFVQVQHQGNLQSPLPDAEIMEKQNDLEIIISKGVKVSISPNIDSTKIIKIIELLKDL